MTAEEAAEKMQKALPRGIRILAADVTATNAPALMAEAGGADYRVTLPMLPRLWRKQAAQITA